MDVSTRPRLLGWRGATLVVVGVVVGSLALAPGIGVAAKFLTKQQVKKRYLGNTTVVSQSSTTGASGASPLTVSCPPGRQATGGGADSPGVFDSSTVTNTIITVETRPLTAGAKSTGWYVEAIGAGSPTTVPFTVYAVCAA
jgi:hypothetical protein